jgi:DNA-binding response OmpR family regulator
MEKRILVVEDDLFLRDIYCETLKNQGYNVEFAKDGDEGLTKIQEGGWDLVLLDVLLPGMTGIEIMQKLKDTQLPTPNKKIIFLTNMDNPKEVNEMHELGIEYWIKSELTPEVLLNKIKANLI